MTASTLTLHNKRPTATSSVDDVVRPVPVLKDVDTDGNRVTVGQKGVVVWLTGLSASGKTTTARLASKEINRRYPLNRVEHLDGDAIRKALSPELGFSPEERAMHLKRVAFHARSLAMHGVVVLCSFISPSKAVRDEIRTYVGEMDIPFVEVYVQAPLQVCEQRDEKGLYERARTGEIHQFTGISAPYDIPDNPEITLDTVKHRPAALARTLVDYLKANGYLYAEKKTSEPKPVEDSAPSGNNVQPLAAEGYALEAAKLRSENLRMQGALEAIIQTAGVADMDDVDRYSIMRVASLALQLDPPARPDGNPSIASAISSEQQDNDDILSMLSEDDFLVGGIGDVENRTNEDSE